MDANYEIILLALNNGRVVQGGPHDELIADAEGLYSSLSRLQNSGMIA